MRCNSAVKNLLRHSWRLSMCSTYAWNQLTYIQRYLPYAIKKKKGTFLLFTKSIVCSAGGLEHITKMCSTYTFALGQFYQNESPTSCNPEVYYHIMQTSGVEQNDWLLLIHSVGSLLVIRPVAALIWVVWSRHLTLGRRTLHSWRRGPSRSRPHPRTEPSWLAERGTKCALVFRELLHGVRVVMMRWWRIDRGATVLWWRSWRRMVHIGGHLAHDVPWWWSDGWGSCGHGGRRGLVVDHVWCPRALGRMLHGVADRRRRWRWGAKVLLWWCHHVVRVGHYRWLARILPRVVVGGLTWTWPTRVGLPRRRGVILDGHRDEIAVFTGGYCGNAECLRAKSGSRRRGFVTGGWGWLTIGVVTAVLKWVGEVNMVLG